MQLNSGENQRIFRSKVDTSGRVLIPAELRSGMYVAEGDSILFVQHRDGVELRTFKQAASKAQDFFCGLAPANVRMSDELIAERRTEAARDD